MKTFIISTIIITLFVSGCDWPASKQLAICRNIAMTARDYLELAQAEAQNACDEINQAPCEDAEKYAQYKAYAETAIEFLSQDIDQIDWSLAFDFADMVIAKLESENAKPKLIFYAKQIRMYLELAFEDYEANKHRHG